MPSGAVSVMRVVVWERLGMPGPEQAFGPLGIPRVPALLDHDRVSGSGVGMGYVPGFACVDVNVVDFRFQCWLRRVLSCTPSFLFFSFSLHVVVLPFLRSSRCLVLVPFTVRR